MSNMKKPIKNSRSQRFNYNEVIKFIESKHKIKVRNFSNYKFGTGDTKEYQDFWGWFLEHSIWPIHNGCEAQLPAKSTCEYIRKAPKWVKDIISLIELDFGDQADEEGYIDVWIEW